MIIECPNCNKKFEIDQNLVPEDGRLLQCGSCSHKWFFKTDVIKNVISEEKKAQEEAEKKYKNQLALKDKENKKNIEEAELKTKNKAALEFQNQIQKKDDELEKLKKSQEISDRRPKQKIKKNFNYLNMLLVIIISITALILIIDTFKNNLEPIFPNIKLLLNNLYQSIEDIRLFIFDLIK
tara:strand:- start:76 stop:618 length:543 start_codon:yes stop_codon:yes gene_type:complete